MTDESVIRWLGEIGGTVRERKVNGNRQRCCRWLLMRQIDVRDFLVAVLPLLRVKHLKASEVILEIEGLDLDLLVPSAEAPFVQDELLAYERLA